MLLVRVTLRPSTIHGLGVFAAEPIAKGAAVWRFTPGLDLELEPSFVEAQPFLLRERLLHYGYIDRRLKKYVLCCDDARFLNHSSEPVLIQDLSVERHGIDRAVRDIGVGEELTVDYEAFEVALELRQ
jgi:SET domain-containing protein